MLYSKLTLLFYRTSNFILQRLLHKISMKSYTTYYLNYYMHVNKTFHLKHVRRRLKCNTSIRDCIYLGRLSHCLFFLQFSFSSSYSFPLLLFCLLLLRHLLLFHHHHHHYLLLLDYHHLPHLLRRLQLLRPMA
jgi:hypothetical protein